MYFLFICLGSEEYSTSHDRARQNMELRTKKCHVFRSHYYWQFYGGMGSVGERNGEDPAACDTSRRASVTIQPSTQVPVRLNHDRHPFDKTCTAVGTISRQTSCICTVRSIYWSLPWPLPWISVDFICRYASFASLSPSSPSSSSSSSSCDSSGGVTITPSKATRTQS
eukprot:COSAG05_NODE_7083_length_857_cov_11.101583_2_plen_168_part_00